MEGLAWKVREVQPGDVPQLCALTELVFGRQMSEAYWNWQFRDNPAGYTKTLVAYVDDQIVGQYAVIPMELCVEGRNVLASLSMDTMTHPDYQRQGVFIALATQLYGGLGHEGVSLTYGFPNDNSLHGFVKRLGWCHITTLDILVRPLNTAHVAQKVIGMKGLASIANRLLSFFLPPASSASHVSGPGIRWVDRFDGRVNELWECVKNSRLVQKVRTETFLNWRYADCPDRDYRLVIAESGEQLLGYIVLRCTEEFGLRGGMIVDVAVRPKRLDIFDALVQEALFYFDRQGMDLVSCLIHGDDTMLKRLKRQRFIQVPQQFGFKKWYFGARRNDDQFSADFVNDPRNWFLTFGDTDII